MKKSRTCKKGFPCGKSCISKSRKCWANLSSDKQKVFETFSQFINRIVGIGNEKESVIVNNSPVSIEQSYDINKELTGKLLGEGQYGKVYDDGDIVIKEGKISPDEVRILTKLKDHPNVVEIVGHSNDRLAMKKAEGEPISRLRENDNFPVIREKLLTALKDIHSKGVAHGDVHANNVFYSEENDKITLIDFGLSEDEDTVFAGDQKNTKANLHSMMFVDATRVHYQFGETERKKKLLAYLKGLAPGGRDPSNLMDFIFFQIDNPAFQAILGDDIEFNKLMALLY